MDHHSLQGGAGNYATLLEKEFPLSLSSLLVGGL
jgi:hypothetical protein